MKIIPLNRAAVLLLTIILSFGVATPLCAQGWTNPIELNGHAFGHGDPYIMKYRGYYYLYVSAGDEKIYCWRSKDLMEWSDAYVCCTDQTTAVAYAPEVIYWNGRFYMCTSPRGGGHYLLTSDSPTGPFVHQTGNLGRDIDGSMFVDDSGQWYFYHANNQGIRGCTMPTHLSFGDDVDLGCCISGQWTEGPCVFKRNGLYYLLYTGNHVWTLGYRIDYAISNGGPLAGFRPQSEQNPILVDTETPTHCALGHGTAFVGPDLDTYFFTYHNLQDNKSRRLLNFERIAWNGDKLLMTGPTCWEQDRPLVAKNDYFERDELGTEWTLTDGAAWQIVDRDHLSQPATEGRRTALFGTEAYEDFTAEFTVRAADGQGACGAMFCYTDADNYSEAMIDVAALQLRVTTYAEGAVQSTKSYSLPADFDPSCWHSLRVEKSGRRTRVYIDGMRKGQLNNIEAGGRIGYATDACAADFSYIAFSPYVDGSGILDISLPVPGIVGANLCTTTAGEPRAVSYRMAPGAAYSMRCTAGDALTYKLNIAENGLYNLGIAYRASAPARLRLLVDGEAVDNSVALEKAATTTATYTVRDLQLPEGHLQLTVEVTEGTVSLYEYVFKRGVVNPHVMADDFADGFSDEWGYREGNWTIVDGQLESTGGYGKMLMGGYEDIHLTDYTVECDIAYPYGAMNGGLLFRTTNASTGGADDNPVLGTDFLQGYIFIAGTTSVVLGKHNFGWKVLASANKNIDSTQPHHMKVEVEGSTIRCYLDDMSAPLITYTDPQPFITGRAGFRAHDSRIRFDNFVVTPKASEPDAIRPPLTTHSTSTSTPTTVYNLLGQPVPPTAALPHGVYIYREGDKATKWTLH